MQGKHLIPISLVFIGVLLSLTGMLYYLLEHSGLKEAVEAQPAAVSEPAPVVTNSPALAPAPPTAPENSGPSARDMWKAGAKIFLEPVIEAPDAAVELGEHVRVCSYNIENFADGYQDGPRRTTERQRRQAFFASEIIREIDPDILMIQEIENEQSLRWLNEYCNDRFSAGYITSFSRRGNRVKLNLAVLSRIPIDQAMELDFGEMDFQNPPPRGLLRFMVSLGGNRRLLCYVTHLKSNWGSPEKNEAKRRNAMRILRKDMEQFVAEQTDTDWEILIAGDMNVDPENERFRNDRTLNPFSDYVDLWHGRAISERTTIPTRHGNSDFVFPPAAFDRMLVSPDLTQIPWKMSPLVSYQQGVDTEDNSAEPGDSRRHVSDHYPVYGDILRSEQPTS